METKAIIKTKLPVDASGNVFVEFDIIIDGSIMLEKQSVHCKPEFIEIEIKKKLESYLIAFQKSLEIPDEITL